MPDTKDTPPRREVIQFGVAVYQGDHSKNYYCAQCCAWLFSTYEGDEIPVIRCAGPFKDHVLEWAS